MIFRYAAALLCLLASYRLCAQQDAAASADFEATIAALLGDNGSYAPGVLFVDSAGPQATANGDPLLPRTTLTGADHAFQAGPLGGIALAFANGVTLYAQRGSTFRIAHYSQTPMSEELLRRRQYEPSRSQLRLELVEGGFSIDMVEMNPRSEVTVLTHGVEVSLSAATAIFHLASEHRRHLYLYEGTAQVTRPDSGQTFLLDAGWQLDLAQAEQMGLVAASSRFREDDFPLRRSWLRSNQQARQRSYFVQTDDGWQGRILHSPQALINYRR